VGSGTGEPALTIAGLVGPSGAVVASDPSPELLATAAERAACAGLANLT
jgi:ubiquinone/menaquinone biosynthesis C-methylase UbiE